MRVIITLENNDDKPLILPFSYNKMITALVYNSLYDTDYATSVHDRNSYKYFSISRVFMYKYEFNQYRNEFNVSNGKITFQVTSPSAEFITNLVKGLTTSDDIHLNGNSLICSNINIEDNLGLHYQQEYKTLSPILSRTSYDSGLGFKTYDLNAGEDKFYENLGKTIVNKYNSYYGVEQYDVDDILVYSNMRDVARTNVKIKSTDGFEINNRAYMMDIVVRCSRKLQEFVCDCGLGEKTAMGFGCLKPVESTENKLLF